MSLHDDRCPCCNRCVLGASKPNQSEVINTDPSMMGKVKTCLCGASLRYSLDTYDTIMKHLKCTLWDEVSV